MTYVLLLRGINVGGKNTVPMGQLKKVLATAGCENVRTYINSGNIVLSDTRTRAVLHDLIEDSLKSEFGFEIKTILLEKQAFEKVAAALPGDWRNNATMRCDVMFLWEEMNSPTILEVIPARPGIDTVQYVDGALLWSVQRDNIKKSGLSKLIGTELYRKMTIRNCNTVRKLSGLIA